GSVGRFVPLGFDRARTWGQKLAAEAGVPTFVVPFRDYTDRSAWDRAMSDRIASHAPDLVVSAGFMRILGPAVVGRHPAVNIHPASLPSSPGARAVRGALARGGRLPGAPTPCPHEGSDTGP